MRKPLLAALAAAPLLGLALPAHATLISIGLQQSGVNGGAITTVATDGGTGSVAYNGAYGSFTVNQVSAVGAPALNQAELDTNAINVSGSGGGTITVWVTEQGLSIPTAVNNFLSSFTSNRLNGAVTSVAETTFVSAANALYGGTQLATATFTGMGTTASVNATPYLNGNYSETTEYVITTTGSANVNDTIDISAVPEPASFAMLGAGLLALAGWQRRRAVAA